MKVFFNIICITIIICTLFGCRNTTPPNENHIEKKDSTLIKDSVLLEKTLSFFNHVDTIGVLPIGIQDILIINFDSIEYRHSKYMRIYIYIAPYFDDTTNITAGYLFDDKKKSYPTVIVDSMKIGTSFYNNIGIDKTIIDKFYCNTDDCKYKWFKYDSLCKPWTCIGFGYYVVEYMPERLMQNEVFVINAQ